ncbi:NUDIX hydrolase [Bacillus sp. WLY-B-L8]|uniref:NUDIX hydrolase n=1 Tax=Bacillus multifaciens TaxID=3068506 RepID=UPI002740D8C5|nr:NUDIX domain-containing protein [Bacillus sp. WLY-B-L8]MDP7979815.1 NUDIX domain-containing protein [Bacillus sp. WLY-B-L8]HDX9589058.1 NUDIX domain-containing protein [Bacillus pseudomycoides]
MYNQTLCFIRNDDGILMLNREKAPLQGLWNGVGGKMIEAETPMACILREIEEETGLHLTEQEVTYKGTLSWTSDNTNSDGLYLFIANLPAHISYRTPKKVAEGILDWKHIPWILSNENRGINSLTKHFLPTVLQEEDVYDHTSVFHNNQLVHYEQKEHVNVK